jgi:hypothetical protein
MMILVLKRSLVSTMQLALLGLLLLPATASAQWMRADFQDSLPFSMSGDWGSDDLNVVGEPGPGPCANGVYWNFSRVAPAAGNGGFNGRGYARWIWCSYAVSRVAGGPGGWSGSGLSFRPPTGWPTNTFFGRVRLYIERPILPAPGGDLRRQFKWFIWHREVYDGDQRVIGFLDSGSNCGRTDLTHVCFTMQRNINHSADTAAVALPVGQWSHLQFSWRHGPSGSSFVKVWLNNNSESAPTAQDLNLTGVPANPGGTSEWLKQDRGYDLPFQLGNSANPDSMLLSDFVVRVMDFELDGRFDSTWAPGGTGDSQTPTAPQNLRILP